MVFVANTLVVFGSQKKSFCWGGKYSGIWRQYMVEKTVLCMANSVIFKANLLVLGADAVKIWEYTVEFGANVLVFG